MADSNSGDLSLGYMMGQSDNGGSNGGWGGFGEGIWAVIILAILFGQGGFGGGGGNVSSGFAWQGIDSGIRGVQQGLCDGFYAMNTGMLNGFHGVDNAICNLGYQTKDCCCETQRMIERGFCETNANISNQTRAILDYLTNEKIDSLRSENQTLRFQASQAAQNQFITQVGSDIVNRLQPVPVPAYQVANPYTGYGYGRDCGCGCN